uniref:Uncharacterized protein n=1 Tax=Anguilla anguilla TaxID=7936 RepID=A0A0E9WFM5_ANGAN
MITRMTSMTRSVRSPQTASLTEAMISAVCVTLPSAFQTSRKTGGTRCPYPTPRTSSEKRNDIGTHRPPPPRKAMIKRRTKSKRRRPLTSEISQRRLKRHTDVERACPLKRNPCL